MTEEHSLSLARALLAKWDIGHDEAFDEFEPVEPPELAAFIREHMETQAP